MILYLDFDGVLHPPHVVVGKGKAGKRIPRMQGPGHLFQWASALEHALVEIPELQIVLSTRWVWWFGLEFTRTALPPALASRVIGATWQGPENMPVGWVHLARCEQVRLHALRHQIEDWIALDDDDQGLADDAPDRDRFLLCDPELGLAAERVQSALASAMAARAEAAVRYLCDTPHADETVAVRMSGLSIEQLVRRMKSLG